jgi:hypothetical protein
MDKTHGLTVKANQSNFSHRDISLSEGFQNTLRNTTTQGNNLPYLWRIPSGAASS